MYWFALVILILIIIALVYVIAGMVDDQTKERKEAIIRGYRQYDIKTGELMWVNPPSWTPPPEEEAIADDE